MATAAEELKKRRQAQAEAARSIRLAKLKRQQEELERARNADGMGSMEYIEDVADQEVRDALQEGIMLAGDARNVVLFSTVNGIPSRVRIEQLVSKLEPGPDGVAPFSEKPVNPDWKYRMDKVTGMPVLVRSAEWKCMLHPDHERRGFLDSIGLAGVTCMKENLPSMFSVRQHMQSRHPQSWNVIRESEEDARRDEERQRQDAILRALSARGAE